MRQQDLITIAGIGILAACPSWVETADAWDDERLRVPLIVWWVGVAAVIAVAYRRG